MWYTRLQLSTKAQLVISYQGRLPTFGQQLLVVEDRCRKPKLWPITPAIGYISGRILPQCRKLDDIHICSCCTDRHAHNTHIHTHPHSYGSHKHTHSYTSHKHTHTSYKLTHAHSYYFTNTQTQPHLCTSHKQLKQQILTEYSSLTLSFSATGTLRG